MKMGIRKPSIKKSISARTTGKLKRTVKKSINPMYGKKGMGYINNPKKAIYNKIYNKITIDSLKDIKKSSSNNSNNKNNTIQSINNNSQQQTYTIINNKEVSFGNIKYNIFILKIVRFLLTTIALLCIFFGFAILPACIFFWLISFIFLSVSLKYKKICKEVKNYKN